MIEESKERKFEEYLQEFHCELFPSILDDDLPDHYENWISNLEIEDIVRLANLHGRHQYLAGMRNVLDTYKPIEHE